MAPLTVKETGSVFYLQGEEMQRQDTGPGERRQVKKTHIHDACSFIPLMRWFEIPSK